MYSVLFVCAANICRSPMAQGLFQARVRAESDAWRIASAGVWAQSDHLIAENTQIVLEQQSIDLSAHRSQPITAQLMADFSLILTMERGQKEALCAAFPNQAHKVWLITELIGQRFDIVDPIGSPLHDYLETGRELALIFERGFERIRALALDPTAEQADED